MNRTCTRWWLLLVMVCVAAPLPAQAQLARRPVLEATAQPGVVSQGELRGVVQDDRGAVLPGAVVSALGSITAFAVSDGEGRFVFRSLPYGPYLLRAHLQGYLSARARIVQVNSGHGTWTLALSRTVGDASPSVLAAGIGGGEETAQPETPGEDLDHDEVAWRLRHLKRSVLKDEDGRGGVTETAFIEDPLASIARAVGGPARVASSCRSQDRLQLPGWTRTSPPRSARRGYRPAPTIGGDIGPVEDRPRSPQRCRFERHARRARLCREREARG